ncbi:M23 family metallopeptidase [Priestia aryabhattai]|uniref:M23 family metallopeptidase n=1 Tax=Priestia aryabhattai TaxID=412384 RepID=UPI0015F38692|nr:M23 family metallopeptidase [Priestia aryabhattai]
MAYKITSLFGQQEGFRTKGHSGIDFATPDDTPLKAVESGTAIVKNFGTENAGLTVKIKFNGGEEVIYGHLNSTNVHTGDVIHKGDLIGYSGHSGHVVSSSGNGAHLHLGLKDGDGHFQDPSRYIEDIQNMNNPNFVQHVTEKTPEIQDKIDISSESSSIFEQVGELFNTIQLIDYSFLVQIIQQSFQFLFIHTSFLYDIIACIF